MVKEVKPQGSTSIGGDASVEIQVTEKQKLFMDSRADEVLYGGAA